MSESKLTAYKSKKEVLAFKIKEVLMSETSSGATLVPTNKDIDPVRVNDTFLNKNKPKKGDFYILYGLNGRRTENPNARQCYT